MNEFEEQILKAIISCEISTYTCSYAPEKVVVTTSNLATLLEWTKYKVRKALRGLMAIGYVEYISQGCPAVESNTENGRELICEAQPPINGYTLTELGFSTTQFRAAYEAWNKSMEQWANRGRMSEQEPT